MVGLERTTVPLIGSETFGLTWSMTVNMKIDLVGPARRGLATGLNEAAGYTAVGATALFTGYLATRHGLRPVPELIGVVFLAAGLALALIVRDTAAHVALETAQTAHPLPTGCHFLAEMGPGLRRYRGSPRKRKRRRGPLIQRRPLAAPAHEVMCTGLQSATQVAERFRSAATHSAVQVVAAWQLVRTGPDRRPVVA